MKNALIDVSQFTESDLTDLARIARTVNSLDERTRKCIVDGSPEEYIPVLFPIFDQFDGFRPYECPTGKSGKDFEYFKTSGNSAFGSHELEDALTQYKKAARFATGPKELAVGYGNISAVLFDMGNYLSCLESIGEAIANGYPLEKVDKLQKRAVKCFKEMGCDVPRKLQSIKDVKEFLKIIVEAVKKLRSDRPSPIPDFSKKYVAEEDFTRSREINAVSESVSLQRTEAKGYHMVANNDIMPGDMILVEEPTVMVQDLTTISEFCHHCCSRIQVPYLCDKCPNVIFCSPSCKDTSQSYHNRECPLLFNIAVKELSGEPLWAVRLATRVEPQQFLNETVEVVKNGEKTSFYGKICKLESHPRSKDGALKLYIAASVWFAVRHLHSYFSSCKTSIRSAMPEMSDTSYHVAIALAKLLTVIRYNRIAITEVPFGDYGSAVYTALSRLNHSCDPNTLAYNFRSKMVVVASRPIRHGSEININYGVRILMDTFERRQKYLKQNYLFECTCQCCLSPPNWLSDRNQEKVEVLSRFGFCCPKCRNPFVWNASIDPDGVYLCERCRAILPLSSLLDRFKSAHDQIMNYNQIELVEDVDDFNVLLDLIVELDDLLGSPSPTGIKAEEKLRYCIESYAAIVMNDGIWQ